MITPNSNYDCSLTKMLQNLAYLKTKLSPLLLLIAIYSLLAAPSSFGVSRHQVLVKTEQKPTKPLYKFRKNIYYGGNSESYKTSPCLHITCLSIYPYLSLISTQIHALLSKGCSPPCMLTTVCAVS